MVAGADYTVGEWEEPLAFWRAALPKPTPPKVWVPSEGPTHKALAQCFLGSLPLRGGHAGGPAQKKAPKTLSRRRCA